MSQAGGCRLVDPCASRYEARPLVPGVEAVSVRLAGQQFSRHSHATYTIVVTTEGVQEFHYRGGTHRSTPGQLVVLHPGEVHDGRPGAGAAFAYVGLQVAASAARRYLPDDFDGRGLPFVADPVAAIPRFSAMVRRAAASKPGLAAHQHVGEVMEWVCALAAGPAHGASEAHAPQMAIAEQYLRDNATRPVLLEELEHSCGLAVPEICRQFKRRYGIPPYRFVLMTRVQLARGHIRAGMPLSEAAIAAGFSDQPHMTRAFRSFLGLTPGAYAALGRHVDLTGS